ncbi:MAG: helix-turn-helix domain-containing protein [Planctomycetota bacterium]
MANQTALYLFSLDTDSLEDLETLGSALPFPTESIGSLEELRGKLEGGQVDYLLLDGRSVGRKLLDCLGEPDPDKLLGLSLAQLEKRHILRVLASTGGNKTRAARILGIDTKTLYNKLKSYEVGEKARNHRVGTRLP